MAHAGGLVAATELAVSADLENGFAADPDGVADIVRAAAGVGLAGCSIEDWDRDGHRLYPIGPATERVAAAAEAARASGLVLTARAENHLRGAPDLADTIRRLQAYQQAGADVLYAPGLTDAEDITRLVRSVDRPVNVLARPGVPPVAELGRLGVRRVSVGGAFCLVAYHALAEAARELRDQGSYGYLTQATQALPLRAAFDHTGKAS